MKEIDKILPTIYVISFRKGYGFDGINIDWKYSDAPDCGATKMIPKMLLLS